MMYPQNRYTHSTIIPGKNYTCGCDLQPQRAQWPQSAVIRPLCRVHLMPIAAATTPCTITLSRSQTRILATQGIEAQAQRHAIIEEAHAQARELVNQTHVDVQIRTVDNVLIAIVRNMTTRD